MNDHAQETRMVRTNSAEPVTCAIDPLAERFAAMRHAAMKAREWGERYAEHRAAIVAHMGAAEVATIGGRPVARHTTTTARRISTEAVRRLPAELVEAVTVEVPSRRFVVVDADDGASV